jgi:hypothetical protein
MQARRSSASSPQLTTSPKDPAVFSTIERETLSEAREVLDTFDARVREAFDNDGDT